jgi:hypothetical protein
VDAAVVVPSINPKAGPALKSSAGQVDIATGSTPPSATPPASTAAGEVFALRASGFPYSRNIVALAKVVAYYTGRQLMKDDVRTSNWEKPLDEEQKKCTSHFVLTTPKNRSPNPSMFRFSLSLTFCALE